MQIFVLKLWQDKEIFQDMEGLVLNHVEIPVEIQDMDIFQGMKIFQDLEALHHKQYIVKIVGKGK